MKVETFPNFEERYTSTDLKSSVNPKKDKREPHNDQIVESQWKREKIWKHARKKDKLHLGKKKIRMNPSPSWDVL